VKLTLQAAEANDPVGGLPTVTARKSPGFSVTVALLVHAIAAPVPGPVTVHESAEGLPLTSTVMVAPDPELIVVGVYAYSSVIVVVVAAGPHVRVLLDAA
jgi:hypothetical protein